MKNDATLRLLGRIADDDEAPDTEPINVIEPDEDVVTMETINILAEQEQR